MMNRLIALLFLISLSTLTTGRFIGNEFRSKKSQNTNIKTEKFYQSVYERIMTKNEFETKVKNSPLFSLVLFVADMASLYTGHRIGQMLPTERKFKFYVINIGDSIILKDLYRTHKKDYFDEPPLLIIYRNGRYSEALNRDQISDLEGVLSDTRNAALQILLSKLP